MNREGLVKLERVRVTCPACGQEVVAVASDSRVKGYCGVARQRVDFVAETQRIGKSPAAEAEISASVKKRWQGPGVRDDVVRAYLRGAKTIDIQLEYKISPGKMYRLLHAFHVVLRTQQNNRCRSK